MKITNAENITKDKATYLLYAAPGIGKTHTIRFLPKDERVLVIDIDKTSHVLKGEKNIDVLDFPTESAWTSWTELLKMLKGGLADEYDTIVVDNISELVRAMLAEAGSTGKNKGAPELAHYNRLDFFLMREVVRAIKGLDKRVVFLAWEMTDEWQTSAGQTFNRVYPHFRKTILENLMGLCDVVGRLVYVPESGNRGFYLQPNDEMFAKNQLDARKNCLQEDIFKVGYVPSKGGADVQTP